MHIRVWTSSLHSRRVLGQPQLHTETKPRFPECSLSTCFRQILAHSGAREFISLPVSIYRAILRMLTKWRKVTGVQSYHAVRKVSVTRAMFALIRWLNLNALLLKNFEDFFESTLEKKVMRFHRSSRYQEVVLSFLLPKFLCQLKSSVITEFEGFFKFYSRKKPCGFANPSGYTKK